MTGPGWTVHSVASLSVAGDTADGVEGGPGGQGGPRYERRGEVGAGGLGRITLAWDRWLGREVALKEARDDAHRAMLLREARVSAQLEHPGILPIHDTGLGDDGSPFFAMPLVRGRSLAETLVEGADGAERGALLRALLAAAEAVAFAHANGVQHLDLKPANVMLGAYGRTLVIDWGMADGPGLADLPAAPSRGGTPRYMSPRRAAGGAPSPEDDVFALGAMLYEVAVGRPAFPGVDTVTDAARPRSAPPWPDSAPRALGAVVMRALGLDGGSPYPSAAPFAADLARYLDGRPVESYAYSAIERAVLFVRRWRVAVAVAGVGLLALLVVAGVLFGRVSEARDRAEALLRTTLLSAAKEEAMLEDRDAARQHALDALRFGPSAEAAGILASVPPGRASVEELGAPPCAPADVVPELPAVICAPRAEDGRLRLWRPGGGEWVSAPRALRDPVFAGDDGVLAIDDGEYVIFDVANGVARHRIVRECPGIHRASAGASGGVSAAAACVALTGSKGVDVVVDPGCGRGGMTAATVSNDGVLAAIACDGGALFVGRKDQPEGFTRVVTGLGPPWLGMTALAFVPGTTEIVVGTQQGWVLRVDPDDPRKLRMWQVGGLVQRIAMAPDGSAAAFFADGAGPVVMDVRAWAPLARLGPDIVAGRFESDGRLLATGRTLTRISFKGLVPRWVGLSHGVVSLAASPDSRFVAVGQAEWLSLVDVATREPQAQASWQSGVIKAVAFDGDGGLFAHGILKDSQRHFRQALTLSGAVDAELPDSPRVAWLKDGTAVVIGWSVGARLWRDGRELRDLQTPIFVDLAHDQETDVVVGLTSSGEIHVATELASGGGFRPCDAIQGARRLAVSWRHGGLEILAATVDEIVGVCGVSVRYRVEGGDLISLSTGPEGVIAGGRDGRVHLWRHGEREPAVSLSAHSGRVAAVLALPGGGFVSGGWDARLFFWTLPVTTLGR